MSIRTIHLCFILSILTVAFASPIIHTKKTYRRLIVFGDSYSDDGSGSWIVSNMTWPVDPAYYNHSFSNGPKWANYLADTLHLDLLDYATGGATADNAFVQGYTGPYSTIPVPSALDQLDYFLNHDSPRKDDIFVHWIGANDALFNTSVTGAEITSPINRDVDRLFRAGARTVLFGNYPPVNMFPATYGMVEYAFGPAYAIDLHTGLIDIVAGYSAYMNTGLIDVQALFANITHDPAAYGIEEKYVKPPTACLKGAYPSDGVPRSLCDDPEKHFFFDSYHPVTQIHHRIAGLFQEQLAEFVM